MGSHAPHMYSLCTHEHKHKQSARKDKMRQESFSPLRRYFLRSCATPQEKCQNVLDMVFYPNETEYTNLKVSFPENTGGVFSQDEL